MKIWKKGMLNEYLDNEDEDFFVSFNGHKNVVPGIDAFDAETPFGETALIKDDNYYILNGDFRKEYEEIIDKGFQKCLELYYANLEKRSFWSSDVFCSENRNN